MEHSKDHLDKEAEGVKDLKRRADLHHDQHDQHDVPQSPPVLKADALVQAMEKEVDAEIEHDEGMICRNATASDIL